MKFRNFAVLFVAIFAICGAKAQDKKFKVHTIAFYNCENLFDTINDPTINDEEYLPSNNWTLKKYKKKLGNLSRVLNEIGISDKQAASPTIIGVAEIENRKVLEDLVKQPLLQDKDYGIVHFNSPDKRGIDVGFLYQKKHFKPTSFKNIPLLIYSQEEDKKKKDDGDEKTDDHTQVDTRTRLVYTRDQLLVTGLLDGEEMHFIVNHWPSRSGGEKRSRPSREAAAALNKKIIDSLFTINPDAKIITMGDFNDGPYNSSFKKVLGAKAKKDEVQKMGIYNPMEEMSNQGVGSLAYRDAWDLFDQILVTEPLIRKDYSSFRYWKAAVYNKPFLTATTGQYKGYPLRSTRGEIGFSDHYPVYLYLIKEYR